MATLRRLLNFREYFYKETMDVCNDTKSTHLFGDKKPSTNHVTKSTQPDYYFKFLKRSLSPKHNILNSNIIAAVSLKIFIFETHFMID